MPIRRAAPGELGILTDIWLRSVRATHGFLAEADIQALLPLVRDRVLPGLPELWVACTDGDRPVGFMGLDGASVEALFIAPEHLRRGAGTRLIEHARRLKGALRVEVNEQNPAAVAFYRVNGFVVTGWSPVDGDGRPFPLLRMSEPPRAWSGAHP